MSDPEAQEGLSFEQAKSKARCYGIVSVLLLAVIALKPVPDLKTLALLGLVVTGWQCLFQGSTAISLALEGRRRRQFQVAVSVAVPLLLSLYFLKDTPVITIGGIFKPLFSPGTCSSWV